MLHARTSRWCEFTGESRAGAVAGGRLSGAATGYPQDVTSSLPLDVAPAWSGVLGEVGTLSAPGRGAHVTVLAAHPDDETLGAGGLICAAAAAGATVTVIVASDGDASHQPFDLAACRRDRVRAAVAALAPRATLRMLGMPGGRLAKWTDRLADAVGELDPVPTHLVTPWSGDRHPDHAACAMAGRIAADQVAARHWQFPLRAWHWDDLDSPSLPLERLHVLRLDGAAHAVKQQALACRVGRPAAPSGTPGDDPMLGRELPSHVRRAAEVFVVDTVSTEYFDQLYRTYTFAEHLGHVPI